MVLPEKSGGAPPGRRQLALHHRSAGGREL